MGSNAPAKMRVDKYGLLVFLLLIFFSFSWAFNSASKPQESISQKFHLSDDEKNSLMEFFRDFLFENGGAYTLFGTKPVTIALIQEPPTEQEQAEWKKYYESLPEEEKKEIRFYKPRYDFIGNYKKWEEIRQRLPIRQFLFGKFRLNDKTETLYFVNIETTVRTLLEHYEIFRRELGYDFDPFQVVFDVENAESSFWNKIHTHQALLGIILGFGQDNAWFFKWWMKYEESQDKMGDFVRSLPSQFSQLEDIAYPDPQHFMLPMFRRKGLYPNDKKIIKQYKKEQRKIKELYKSKDEVEVALEWLTK